MFIKYELIFRQILFARSVETKINCWFVNCSQRDSWPRGQPRTECRIVVNALMAPREALMVLKTK